MTDDPSMAKQGRPPVPGGKRVNVMLGPEHLALIEEWSAHLGVGSTGGALRGMLDYWLGHGGAGPCAHAERVEELERQLGEVRELLEQARRAAQIDK